MKDSDNQILTRLKKPIDDLVTASFPEANQYQRLRLRQLAWQAVDLLVKSGNAAGLKAHKDILRLTSDIKLLGASDQFIDDSLSLAVRIYQQLQVDYPDVLGRYRP